MFSSFAQRLELAVSLVSASTAVLLRTESEEPELISTLLVYFAGLCGVSSPVHTNVFNA